MKNLQTTYFAGVLCLFAGCAADGAPDGHDDEESASVTASKEALSSTFACDSVNGITAPVVSVQSNSGDLPTCKDGYVYSTTQSGVSVLATGAPETAAPITATINRYACVYNDANATSAAKRPLVIFYHGSGGTADDLPSGLISKSSTYPLIDASHLGYVLVSVQGRVMPEWPGKLDNSRHHDYFYHNLSSPSPNPDIAFSDSLIDTIIASGIGPVPANAIDTSRIYVVGWSNGAFFAQEYAAGRFGTPTTHSRATPGGHKVAGSAVYAGADPYLNWGMVDLEGCPPGPYFHTTVPLYVIHRACDSVVPCSADQAANFGLTDTAFNVSTWYTTATTIMADPTVSNRLIDAIGIPVSSCQPASNCPLTNGLINHLDWPANWESEMLAFMSAHPHP